MQGCSHEYNDHRHRILFYDQTRWGTDRGLLKKWQIDIPSNSALTNGGRIIGYLERILILTFVLVGKFTGVGFVLAAKSIFRFSEVSGNSISRTEYFIIGTFLSVATSLITGVTVNYLVH